MKERTKKIFAFGIVLLLGFTIGIIYQQGQDSWCVDVGFKYLEYKNISLISGYSRAELYQDAMKFIQYLKGGS